jgi:hypothetical protein
MPFYRVRRHVIFKSGCQQTEEVWGIDRQPPPALKTARAPRYTDVDDPVLDPNMSDEGSCPVLLKLNDGRWVTWHRIWAWLSEAEAAGYELVSGFQDITPYSTLVIRGP